MQALALPRVLREKLGTEASDALAETLDMTVQHAVSLSAERFERRLAEEVGKVRIDLADFRADMIKWSFLFWIGQVGAMAALLSLMP